MELEKGVELTSELTNRSSIFSIDNIGDRQRQAFETKTELYRSYYMYGLNEINRHIQDGGTITNFEGTLYPPTNILIDVDGGHSDIDQAIDSVKQVVAFIREYWEIDPDKNLIVWVSGRGFHVEFPTVFSFQPSPDLPRIYKETIHHYLGQFGIDSSIYKRNSLIRVGYTWNAKAGRYKFPLHYEDFCGITKDTFANLNIASLDYNPGIDYDSTPPIEIEPIKVAATKRQLVEKQNEDPVFNSIVCVQEMFNNAAWAMQNKSRHHFMLRMVSAYRRAGVPKPMIRVIFKGWAGLEETETDRIIEDVFQKDYQYSCQDELMKKYCKNTCNKYSYRNKVPVQVFTSQEIEKEYVEDIRNSKIKGINLNQIWDGINYGIEFGTYTILTGDTGIGKSTFAQNISVGLPQYKILYLNLELKKELIWRRSIQIAHKMTKQQVLQHYEKFDNCLSEAISHIYFINAAPDFNEISAKIKEIQADITVIDTVEHVHMSEFTHDLTTKSHHLAVALCNLAQSINKIIIGVQHINKSSAVDFNGKPKPLSAHSLKGASASEQMADNIIGIEQGEYDDMRSVRTLKSRDESKFDQSFLFDYRTFKFSPIFNQAENVGSYYERE